jgi:tRNA(His) guanylyltransferase
MRIDFDKLGDVQKKFEQESAGAAIMPGIPVLARLDGRAFHSFVRGLNRPFDPSLSLCMRETAKFLVKETRPEVAYTQSDEITLAWLNPEDVETKITEE